MEVMSLTTPVFSVCALTTLSVHETVLRHTHEGCFLPNWGLAPAVPINFAVLVLRGSWEGCFSNESMQTSLKDRNVAVLA